MANLSKVSSCFYLGLAGVVAGLVFLRVPPVDSFWSLTLAPALLVPAGIWPRHEQTADGTQRRSARWRPTGAFLLGAGVFTVALTIYLATLWPGPGWWNSSEYISCSYTLGVTAPPGSFLLQLLGRLASLVILVTAPAVRINALVAVLSATAITIVYMTTTRVIRSFEHAGERRGIATLAAALAALTLAFTYSVWSKATFTNAYALSLLASSLLVYLAVRWWEEADNPGGGNWLLLAAFLFGLDLSVHRSNLLLAPAFFVIVLLRRPTALRDFRLWLAGVGLFVLGLSLQLGIMLRSQLDPLLNTGDPDTWGGLWDYLTLSQFGIKTFGSDLLQRKGPFWEYQVKEMYLRYFGWNFIGMDSAADRVRWTGLWAVPLLAGLAGLVYHFVRSHRQMIALAVMLFCAAFLAIMYLNVPAGFFRDMDRHFLCSFMLFSIWIGVGCYAALRLASSQGSRRAHLSSGALWITATILCLALPINVLLANWTANDMSANRSSHEFGRNLLQSCEPDAILITAGDSDTYLPWYMQIVESVRPDVTVLNIGLLNTVSYLRTTIVKHPDLPWTLSEDSLPNLGIIPWEADTVIITRGGLNSSSLSWVVEPSIPQGYLLVQDQVLLDILRENAWKRPICFSAGFGMRLPLGLRPHTRLDGLIRRIVTDSLELADYRRLEDNLLRRYEYRGLEKWSFLDKTGRNMITMYQTAFAHLAERCSQTGDEAALERVEQKFAELWPETGGLKDWVAARKNGKRP